MLFCSPPCYSSLRQAHDTRVQLILPALKAERTAPTKHGVTRKRSKKRLKHTGNLFRKNLKLKSVC